MPNWCANRLRVTGLAENVSKVRALMAGAVRPSYAWAKAQGIQLLLAGCAGVLRPVTNETYAPYAPPDNDMREMTVAEFKARLDAIGDDELCCGTFWLADDFLSIDPALTREEIASAMETAEDNHDAGEGFNWGHLEWAISEMKQGGDV